MQIDAMDWGRIDGKTVQLFTLKAGDLVMKVTSYGCIITELHVPGRDGKAADVVLGFDSLDGYLAGHPYFGAIVGRCANRIPQGRFELGGKAYQLAKNDDKRHHLHGGVKGFDKYVWDAHASKDGGDASLQLSRVSSDGEENYPGELRVKVTYTLTAANELKVAMSATTKATTIVNLAQHTYWNLAGHDSGDIRKHELTLYASQYTPVDMTLIPTGQLAPVARTPFDFIKPKAIGRDLALVGYDPRGYDTNFAINGAPDVLRPCASVYEPTTGRTLELLTDQPGVQLYTGNFLDGTIAGKCNTLYHPYQAFCLETQKYPDAIHHPDWPSVILEPGKKYRHTMVHQFGVR